MLATGESAVPHAILGRNEPNETNKRITKPAANVKVTNSCRGTIVIVTILAFDGGKSY
jgi:hypothetical protein